MSDVRYVVTVQLADTEPEKAEEKAGEILAARLGEDGWDYTVRYEPMSAFLAKTMEPL